MLKQYLRTVTPALICACLVTLPDSSAEAFNLRRGGCGCSGNASAAVGYAPVAEPGYSPAYGYAGDMSYGSYGYQPAAPMPATGYAPQIGYAPQTGYAPQPVYAQQFGYAPQPGYMPNPAMAPFAQPSVAMQPTPAGSDPVDPLPQVDGANDAQTPPVPPQPAPMTPATPWYGAPSTGNYPATNMSMNPYVNSGTMYQPPAGTLGRTYRFLSSPVPPDKHARIAMIEVRARRGTEVTVHGLKAFLGEDGVTWHFETPKPLIPGNEHIYDVTAKYVENGREIYGTWKVRLIPGRIVYLSI